MSGDFGLRSERVDDARRCGVVTLVLVVTPDLLTKTKISTHRIKHI